MKTHGTSLLLMLNDAGACISVLADSKGGVRDGADMEPRIAENRCPEYPDDLADELLLGHLSPADQAAFQEHICACPSCRDAVRSAAVWIKAIRAVVAEGDAIAARDPVKVPPAALSRWHPTNADK